MAHFTAPQFPEFAWGQVEGYFGGPIPSDFWPIYTLYVAMSLHSDLVWTKRFWPELLDSSYKRVAEICQTHDFTAGSTPGWYSISS